MNKADLTILLEFCLLKFDDMSEEKIYLHIDEIYPNKKHFILAGIKLCEYLQTLEVKNENPTKSINKN